MDLWVFTYHRLHRENERTLYGTRAGPDGATFRCELRDRSHDHSGCH